MNNIIKLDNDYYIKRINKNSVIPINAINIHNLDLIKVLKNENIILKIDFDEFNITDYKRILKKLLLVKNIATRMKKEFGIMEKDKNIIAYVINFDENNLKQNDFISGINAIFYNTRFERYNYIYDTVCDYLDSYFYGKNLCDFQNNKCGEKRNTSSTAGCCHHAKYKILGPFSKLVLCEYLNKEKLKKINDNAEKQIDIVIKNILNKKEGNFMKNKLPAIIRKTSKKYYEKARETRHLHVNDNCIGCGLCARNCPVNAIKIENNKPIWVKEKCVMCLRCLHHCPKFAIQYDDKTQNHGQYVHF